MADITKNSIVFNINWLIVAILLVIDGKDGLDLLDALIIWIAK